MSFGVERKCPICFSLSCDPMGPFSSVSNKLKHIGQIHLMKHEIRRISYTLAAILILAFVQTKGLSNRLL